MNILAELRRRFRQALAPFVADPSEYLDMIRPAQDARFGDYQANMAMPLGNRLKKPPKEIALQIVAALELGDMCEQPIEIAGPGFINLRLRDDWLIGALRQVIGDDRLGVPLADPSRTYVIDYSSPNVAKPMHVGHIRSTVIGDALDRILRFAGHRVISDNHLGDWGTQFGMIIYGYKHFRDDAAFRERPVAELGRLYKLVNQLVGYHESLEALPALERNVAQRTAALSQQAALPVPSEKGPSEKGPSEKGPSEKGPSEKGPSEKNAAKAAEKQLQKLRMQQAESVKELAELKAKIAAFEADGRLMERWRAHATIASSVLAETAKLHAGDPENLRLWEAFLPNCRDEIQRLYGRLQIRFDHELGESFYHDRLGKVVADLVAKGMARESEGAMCVFLEGFETPMIIRKKDGAYLYATTDLATIQYRVETWNPNSILYVVDHRQAEHFEKLFAAARQWTSQPLELRHISFGTVLGSDGKPYKTRSGENVGLESLLDEAVQRAYAIVAANDEQKKQGAELSAEERQSIAETVGVAALKYADLSQNRTSDYEFSYDKMLAMKGNTATYMQYSFARVNGIFRKGQVDVAALRQGPERLRLTEPEERSVGLAILRFSESLAEVLTDFRPNLLTNYLFDLTERFFAFYEKCSVLEAETPESRDSRLLLCDLVARVVQKGLDLLGIRVVFRM